MSKLGLTPGFKFKNNHSPSSAVAAQATDDVVITFVQV
jgi:hypothetical protein